MKAKTYLSFAAGIIFHPVYTLREIKRHRSEIRIIIPLLLILAGSAIWLFSNLLFSFQLSGYNPEKTNLFFEYVKILLPILTFTVSAYIMTSINDGEMTFTEFLTATAYTMVPCIFLMPAVSLFSHILSANQQSLFNSLTAFPACWMVLLMLVSIGVLNDYSMKQTLILVLLTVVTMFVIWFITFILYAMVTQIARFIMSILKEVSMLIQYGR